VLPVCETETADVLEAVLLSDKAALLVGCGDEEADVLPEEESVATFVAEYAAVEEILAVLEGLTEIDTDPESLYDIVPGAEIEALTVLDDCSLEVYVPETVNVTPVGNVVILTVGLLATEPVTDRVFEAVVQRDTEGDGVADSDLDARVDAVIVLESIFVAVSFTVDESVVDAKDDLLPLAEPLKVGEELDVLELLTEPVTDCVFILLLEDLGLYVEEGVHVSIGDTVEVKVP
jgi:hypothetical protein